MIDEIIDLLDRVLIILAIQSQLIIRMNGEQNLESIIHLDNQIYTLVSKAIELLSLVEEVNEPP